MMNHPVIERLKAELSTPSLNADDKDTKFFAKIVSSHTILNLEYSFLGQQIRTNLLTDNDVIEQELIEQLEAAIELADLLSNVYKRYLNVPREVARLNTQQNIYKEILAKIQNEKPSSSEDNENVSSPSNILRIQTRQLNFYRLIFVRSKRALDIIAANGANASWYRYVISHLDKYTDNFIAHLGWFFYVPRLTTNLFLLIKHMIPNPWMSDEEAALPWNTRLKGQLLRRWDELANDMAWVTIGVLNCFIFLGPLAPLSVYFTIVFFGFDAIISATRAYIELSRLYELRQQYQEMPEGSQRDKHIETINKQIRFETFRLGSHLIYTIAAFLSMCCAAPTLAANPIVPIIGGCCLVLATLINFALVPIIEHYRPIDMVKTPKEGINNLRFFAKEKAQLPPIDPEVTFCAIM